MLAVERKKRKRNAFSKRVPFFSFSFYAKISATLSSPPPFNLRSSRRDVIIERDGRRTEQHDAVRVRFNGRFARYSARRRR